MTTQRAQKSLTQPADGLPPPPLRPRRVVFRGTGLDRVEDETMYRYGGYHPSSIGDVVGRKFKIIHKLGNGGFGLVWLARDLTQDRYVALKILRADASNGEATVLQHLNAAGLAQVPTLHETFTITGPNGTHHCLVTDFGGPSLRHLSTYCKRPPHGFLQSAARKLVEGLAALHAAGVCHGDLSHSNILFKIKSFDSWTEDDIYRFLGPPKTAPLLLLDGSPAPPFAPSHLVSALNYSCLNENQLSDDILIVDFGEAFFKDSVPDGLGTHISFLAPELLFGYAPSFAVDLWALGCLMFEIHAFRILIPTGFGSWIEVLAMANQIVGALPDKWQHSYLDENDPLESKSGEIHPFFDPKYPRYRTLESQILEHLPELSQDQNVAFLQLIRAALVFEPDTRLPAAEVAKLPWFACEL